MAKVHNNQQDVQGIKLFGKTIVVSAKQEKDEQPPAKSSKENDVGDQSINKKAEKVISCPRCHSMDTKFCYYNNYNINQPRHFCRSCQRYWTAGGALREVPVGAGRRKMKQVCVDGVERFSQGHLFDHDGTRVQTFDVVVESDFPAKRQRS